MLRNNSSTHLDSNNVIPSKRVRGSSSNSSSKNYENESISSTDTSLLPSNDQVLSVMNKKRRKLNQKSEEAAILPNYNSAAAAAATTTTTKLGKTNVENGLNFDPEKLGKLKNLDEDIGNDETDVDDTNTDFEASIATADTGNDDSFDSMDVLFYSSEEPHSDDHPGNNYLLMLCDRLREYCDTDEHTKNTAEFIEQTIEHHGGRFYTNNEWQEWSRASKEQISKEIIKLLKNESRFVQKESVRQVDVIVRDDVIVQGSTLLKTLCRKHYQEYLHAFSITEEQQVTKKVIESLKSMGGRFLSLAENDIYVKVPDEKVSLVLTRMFHSDEFEEPKNTLKSSLPAAHVNSDVRHRFQHNDKGDDTERSRDSPNEQKQAPDVMVHNFRDLSYVVTPDRIRLQENEAYAQEISQDSPNLKDVFQEHSDSVKANQSESVDDAKHPETNQIDIVGRSTKNTVNPSQPTQKIVEVNIHDIVVDTASSELLFGLETVRRLYASASRVINKNNSVQIVDRIVNCLKLMDPPGRLLQRQIEGEYSILPLESARAFVVNAIVKDLPVDELKMDEQPYLSCYKNVITPQVNDIILNGPDAKTNGFVAFHRLCTKSLNAYNRSSTESGKCHIIDLILKAFFLHKPQGRLISQDTAGYSVVTRASAMSFVKLILVQCSSATLAASVVSERDKKRARESLAANNAFDPAEPTDLYIQTNDIIDFKQDQKISPGSCALKWLIANLLMEFALCDSEHSRYGVVDLLLGRFSSLSPPGRFLTRMDGRYYYSLTKNVRTSMFRMMCFATKTKYVHGAEAIDTMGSPDSNAVGNGNMKSPVPFHASDNGRQMGPSNSTLQKPDDLEPVFLRINDIVINDKKQSEVIISAFQQIYNEDAACSDGRNKSIDSDEIIDRMLVRLFSLDPPTRFFRRLGSTMIHISPAESREYIRGFVEKMPVQTSGKLGEDWKRKVMHKNFSISTTVTVPKKKEHPAQTSAPSPNENVQHPFSQEDEARLGITISGDNGAVVKKYHENDVLLGILGQRKIDHPGNVLYRKYCREAHLECVKSGRTSTSNADSIMNKIFSQKPPGRFLEQSNGRWVCVPGYKVKERITQCIRDMKKFQYKVGKPKILKSKLQAQSGNRKKQKEAKKGVTKQTRAEQNYDSDVSDRSPRSGLELKKDFQSNVNNIDKEVEMKERYDAMVHASHPTFILPKFDPTISQNFPRFNMSQQDKVEINSKSSKDGAIGAPSQRKSVRLSKKSLPMRRKKPKAPEGINGIPSAKESIRMTDDAEKAINDMLKLVSFEEAMVEVRKYNEPNRSEEMFLPKTLDQKSGQRENMSETSINARSDKQPKQTSQTANKEVVPVEPSVQKIVHLQEKEKRPESSSPSHTKAIAASEDLTPGKRDNRALTIPKNLETKVNVSNTRESLNHGKSHVEVFGPKSPLSRIECAVLLELATEYGSRWAEVLRTRKDELKIVKNFPGRSFSFLSRCWKSEIEPAITAYLTSKGHVLSEGLNLQNHQNDFMVLLQEAVNTQSSTNL